MWPRYGQLNWMTTTNLYKFTKVLTTCYTWFEINKTILAAYGWSCDNLCNIFQCFLAIKSAKHWNERYLEGSASCRKSFRPSSLNIKWFFGSAWTHTFWCTHTRMNRWVIINCMATVGLLNHRIVIFIQCILHTYFFPATILLVLYLSPAPKSFVHKFIGKVFKIFASFHCIHSRYLYCRIMLLSLRHMQSALLRSLPYSTPLAFLFK